jgi:response regulator of citrate/malate metabolism
VSTPAKSVPLIITVGGDYSSNLVLTKRLQSFGFKNEILATPEEAIEYALKTRIVPDLILVNLAFEDDALLNLPKLLREKTEWGSSVLCAITSAIAERPTINKALKRGFVDYIIRPIEQELFRDRIDKLTKRSTSLSTETFQCPMDEPVTLSLKAHLTQVNEFGVTATASKSIPEGTTFQLNSETLNPILEGPAVVRVVGNSQLNENLFEITFMFIALDPHQARQLRRFAMYSKKSG